MPAARLGDLRHFYDRPPLLVPESRTGEVAERVSAQGEVLLPLDEAALRATVRELREQDVKSVAVCLLFSFLKPEHEERARAIIAEEMPGIAVSLSSDIVPQIREYYRLSTTVINAYLEPILARYIANLEQRLGRRPRQDAAEIHHAVERRHGDVLGEREEGRGDRALGPRGRDHRERADLPHHGAARTSSPSTWAARPATSR